MKDAWKIFFNGAHRDCINPIFWKNVVDKFEGNKIKRYVDKNGQERSTEVRNGDRRNYNFMDDYLYENIQ